MYTYADESGHTGRAILDAPPYYFQGAILSTSDTEPLLSPICEEYRVRLEVDRLHANELHQSVVEEIGHVFLEALAERDWVFHVTGIEKQYLSITKFVDSIFDSSENKGARWLWYNHEYFRHTLCCFFDELFPLRIKRVFWEAYLQDDYQNISHVLEYALDRLQSVELDARLREVSTDALNFAIGNPQEITLMASRTKKSYKGHTPNMVAFVSLLQAVHRFCNERDISPSLFVHDPQCEFGQTMGEYHNLLSNVRIPETDSGFWESPEQAEYGLGEFYLRPSKDVASLQAVDAFLGLVQRQDGIADESLKRSLDERTEPFYISRDMSEMITYSWLLRLSGQDMSQDQLAKAQQIVGDLERGHLERLSQFQERKNDPG